MSAGQFHWSKNPLGLYRDVANAKIAGVCAGLGNYLAICPRYIRIAAILACCFGFFVPVLAVYALLAVVLKPMPELVFNTPSEEKFWRSMAASPNRSASDLGARFRTMDRRLSDIEAKVTSEEFMLRQKFQDLRG